MEVYLSKITLNINKQTEKLIKNPYQIHKDLCGCFNSTRQDSNILFSILKSKDSCIILVQSSVKVNWAKLPWKQILNGTVKTITRNLQVQNEQLGNFSIKCFPSKKLTRKDCKHSARRYLGNKQLRLEWLNAQGLLHGFEVIDLDTHTESKWLDFKQTPTRQTVATEFKGTLKVTDAVAFTEALKKGIGPQKAFGLGMMKFSSI